MSKNATQLNRRQLLKLAGMTAAAGTALAACAPAATPAPAPAPAEPAAPAAPAATEAPAPTEAPKPTEAPAPTEAPKPTEAPAKMMSDSGKELPADAAKPEQQVLVYKANENLAKGLDISATVYDRPAVGDLFGIPLTRVDKDFNMIPGAASEWTVSDNGLNWTFKLREDLKWSDGSSLTADDFVATFQYMANPDSAYDFAWYYSSGSGNIANFDDVVAKKKPVEEVGVRKGANDFELLIDVAVPTPYLPRLFVFAMPLQAKALKATGPFYNADPATAVSCGPFIVKEYTPTRIEYVANKSVHPDFAPYINRVIQVPFPNGFQAYQAGQIDFTGVGDLATVETVLADADLSKQAAPDVGDFRTDYFFFDVRKKPFDNVKFRQALAHLLDRDSIVKFITKPVLARPAYSFLAPGFPAGNGEALKDIQKFDVELAKSLYAESGEKPEKLTLQVRVDTGFPNVQMAQAYADSIKTNLGIEVEVKQVVQKDFMADLLKNNDAGERETTIDFGFISYGFDYLDPSNMLTVLKSGGRHTWKDEEYDKALETAGPMKDGPERVKLYQDAEKRMVESGAFVWAVHRTPLNLFKPYVKGSVMLPGKVNTNPGYAWPGFSSMCLNAAEVYIGKEAETVRTSIP
jgi:ABC-type transport system substrate-binding protein